MSVSVDLTEGELPLAKIFNAVLPDYYRIIHEIIVHGGRIENQWKVFLTERCKITESKISLEDALEKAITLFAEG